MNITKESFKQFEELFHQLHLICYADTTWEQKHNDVFSQPLAKQICEVGLMTIPDIQSTNKVEVESFYRAVYHKYHYLKEYYGGA